MDKTQNKFNIGDRVVSLNSYDMQHRGVGLQGVVKLIEPFSVFTGKAAYVVLLDIDANSEVPEDHYGMYDPHELQLAPSA